MHTHNWQYDKKRREWRCKCGASISDRELFNACSQSGNVDFDPHAGLDRIERERHVQRK